MVRGSLSAAASLLVLLSGGCKSAPQPFSGPEGDIAAGAVRVNFQPPAGEQIVERSMTQRTERRGQAGVEEVVKATLNSRFDRRERGWTLTQGVTDVEVRHAGKLIDNPLVQLVTRFPIRVRLAEDGAFVQLENPEEIETAIREVFTDPNEAKVMLQYFAPEALEAQVRREWEGKYGGLLGREVAPGFAVYQVDSVTTADGAELFHVVERKVTGVRRRDHGRELVLEISCPLRVQDAARPEEMMRKLEEAGSPPLNASVRCEGEQVVGLEPFVPRSTAQQVIARVEGAEGGPVEIRVVKELRTESIKAPAGQEAP
jgi:hypothetical protein